MERAMRLRTIARRVRGAATLIFCFGVFLGRSHCAEAPFYQGKTITVIEGTAAGGSGDMRTRAVIPFLRKYIPGNPTVIVEYMPGAGGRKAANYLFSMARPNGLTIGTPNSAFIASAVLGEQGVQYDVQKFIYLGSPRSASHAGFITRKDIGLSSIEKLQSARGLRIGAQSVGHDVYIKGRLFAWLLGLKEPKFITGYSGRELDIAIERGEVDARSERVESILAEAGEQLEKAPLNIHATLNIPKGSKHPRFTWLPELDTFSKTETDEKLLLLFRSLGAGNHPFMLPPETPKETTEILREALRKTFMDPEFYAEFKKLTGEAPTPLFSDQHEKSVREMAKVTEVAKLYKLLAGGDALPARR